LFFNPGFGKKSLISYQKYSYCRVLSHSPWFPKLPGTAGTEYPCYRDPASRAQEVGIWEKTRRRGSGMGGVL